MHRVTKPIFSPNSDVRIPGEFEPQEAIVFGCGQLVKHYPQSFIDLVSLLYDRVKLFGVAEPSAVRLGGILLGTAGLPKDAVTFVPLRTSAMWVRDFSPVASLDRSGRRVFLRFRHSHMQNRDDIGLAEIFRTHFAGRSRDVNVHLEGGNLLSNGAGFIISSKTILAQNANRADHAGIASILDRLGGAAQWACATPLNGERTGHIDLLTTFLGPNLVAVADADEREDPNNRQILEDLSGALNGFRTGAGTMEVVRLPMPYSSDTHYRSYNNMIFANGVIVVPTFPEVDPKLDKRALSMIAEWMPGWTVRGLDCSELSRKGGSLHCLTMNIPAEPRKDQSRPTADATANSEIFPR